MKRHTFFTPFMRFIPVLSLLALLTSFASPTRAALISTEFSDIVGNQGSVDIQLDVNSGEILEGFQVFFSESLFSNLTILNSPTGWDSLLLNAVQGPIIFDSFNGAGLSSGKARLSFTFLGQTPVQSLEYEFYNANFDVIGGGVSSTIKSSVPESSSLALLLLGLGLVSIKRSHQKNLQKTYLPQGAAQ